MSESTSLQLLLEKRLHEYRTRNPQFSMRAYAKKLGLSSGAMTEILSGQRNPSRKLVSRIAEKLLLDPVEQASLLKEYPEKKARGPIQETIHYLKLSADQFKAISEWYYFAMITLTRTKGFRGEIAWVAKRLGISKPVAEKAFSVLCRLGFLRVEKDGTWIAASPANRTQDDFTHLSVQKNHFQTLELAKASLEKDTIQERDFTSLTLPLNFEDLTEAKQMIREFQSKFFEHFNSKQKSKEVFRLAVQLFPLTQPEERNE